MGGLEAVLRSSAFGAKLVGFRHFVENIMGDIFIFSSVRRSLLATLPFLPSALFGCRGCGPCLSLTCSFPSACKAEIGAKVAVSTPTKK